MKREQLESLKTSLYKLRATAKESDHGTLDEAIKAVNHALALGHTLKEISRIGAKHST